MTLELIEVGVVQDRGVAQGVSEKVAAIDLGHARVREHCAKMVTKVLECCTWRPAQPPSDLAELAFDEVVSDPARAAEDILPQRPSSRRTRAARLSDPRPKECGQAAQRVLGMPGP